MIKFKDTPITRQSIETMSNDMFDEFLTQLRERRLAAYRHYQQATAARDAILKEKTTEKLDKQLDMCMKEFERVDKCLTKLDERVLKIRALRLEIGIYDNEK